MIGDERKINYFRSRSGMTLIELLISVFILSLILLSSVALAGSYLKGRTALKNRQQKLEEMSLVMNDMAKKLRMSNCDDGGCAGSNAAEVNSQSNYGAGTGQIHYEFDEPSKQLLDRDGNVMLENVHGNFSYQYQNAGEIRLITIKIWEDGKADTTAIQTSVSQRSAYAPE